MATSNFWQTAPRVMNYLKNSFAGMVPKTFQKAIYKHGQAFPPGLEGGLPTWVYTEFPTLAAQATDDCIMDLPSNFVLLGYQARTFTESDFAFATFSSGLQAGVTAAVGFTFPLPNPVAIGDQVAIGIEINGSASPPSTFVDNLGNVWTQESSQVGGGDNHNFSVYNSSITDAGDCEITLKPAATVNLALVGVQVTGSGTIQLTSPVNNTGTSAAWPSVALTPSTANTQLFAFAVGYAAAPPALAPSDAFTLEEIASVSGTASTTQLALATFHLGAIAATTSKWVQGASAEWQTVLIGFSINPPSSVNSDFRVQLYDVNGEVDLIPGKAVNFGNIAGNRGRVLFERNPYTFEGSDPQCEIRISNLSLDEVDVQFALYGLQGVPPG